MDEGKDFQELSMLDLFRLETENQTAVLCKELLALERNPLAGDRLEKLMRASHSMKGAARIVGLDAIVSVAHKMEDCFVAAQKGLVTINSEHIDVLLNAVDTMNTLALLSEQDMQNWLQENKHYMDQLEAQLVAIGKNFDFIDTGFVKSSDLVKKTGLVEIKEALQSQTKGENVTDGAFPVGREFTDGDALLGGASNRTQVHLDTGDTVLRIEASSLTRLMGLSSELMVEARWLRPYADSMLHLKRRYCEISTLLEKVRESIGFSSSMPYHIELLSEAQKKLADCRNTLSERILELDDYDRRSNNLSSKMYNEVLNSRMRPFSDAVHGLQRMARDIARDLGKQVQVLFAGLDTPVDRDVLQKLKAPLVHLVRNAVDHGIELPDFRTANAKDSTGTIKISASHVAGMLVIVVEDDGKGIDLEEIKQKIRHKGLLAKDVIANLNESELLEFLYLPDFSTKGKVTELSGRGVGLNIVKNLVHETRGNVRLSITKGKGIKFRLYLPLSTSVVTGLVVRIANEPYAFPLSRVETVTAISSTQINVINGRQYIELNGEFVGLLSAAELFGMDDNDSKPNSIIHVVIIGNSGKKYAISVDNFVGQKELSVQPLDARLGKVQDISAAALDEEGRPLLIIDVDDLMRSVDVQIAEDETQQLRLKRDIKTIENPKSILVIDDSITVRELQRQLLTTHGYSVDVAVDGIDGWNAVRRKKYHLLIIDVDMPRMDGLELVQAIKQDLHLKSLPIMIVSYKDRPEDKQRGLEVGADYYLTKGSFHDETLIEAVVDLIGTANE